MAKIEIVQATNIPRPRGKFQENADLMGALKTMKPGQMFKVGASDFDAATVRSHIAKLQREDETKRFVQRTDKKTGETSVYAIAQGATPAKGKAKA